MQKLKYALNHSVIAVYGRVLVVFFCIAVKKAEPAGIKRVRPLSYKGQSYVSLNDIGRFYGLRVDSGPGRYISLRSKWTDMQFETTGRRVRLNDILVWLNAPLSKIRRRWTVSEADATAVIDPLLRQDEHLNKCGYRVVVLDPGHGGKDRGGRGRRGVEEKRVALDLAKRARKHLVNAGMKVYLTRDFDRFIPLQDRPRKAGRWNADLFVSIHLNACATPGAKGIETFVMTAPGYTSTNARNWKRIAAVPCNGNRYDEANAILGYCLQRRLLDETKSADRGLRRARFLVLKEAPCPAALVECGFLSNHLEEEKFLKREYRETVARGISNGILDYINAVKRAHVAAP